MSHQLNKLLSAITTEEIIGSDAITVDSITVDSRKVAPGSLFVALRGVSVDSHRFIGQAVASGAVAVVCEQLPELLESTATYIKVADSAVALGYLASQWYDNPSRKLRLTGVTGTNGKTTCATLLFNLVRFMGYRAGLLSTVCNRVNDRVIEADHTTPDPLTLNSLLAEMVEDGCDYVFMEVSSHAAHQHRIAGLHFAGGVFTNLTRDHLDYHKTFDAYLEAKKSFFDNLPKDAFALTNTDDRTGMVMLQNCRARCMTYSLRSEADFRGRVIEDRIDGMLMSFNSAEVETRFVGRFNAYNLTAVYGAAVMLGFPAADIFVAISRLTPVAGRFQTLRSPSGFTAIVDYAHTPDALANVLDTIREVIPAEASIITVTGAGGNRDKGKRPIMAAEAARRSDRLILTSDNPRDEDPAAIIADMKEGLDRAALAMTLAITDRREAIRTACALARPADVVLVAGKGHENYQEIAGTRHPFDDRRELLDCFADFTVTPTDNPDF